MNIRISLIVPTHNRAKYLRESIPTFMNQSLNKSIYEIIVVDNNSSDQTKDVVYQFLESSEANWKYIFEKQQGLHYARNRGILEAKGDIIVFGDDDISATENWLQAILLEFDENSKTGICGGKILPVWNEKPPKWIYDYGSEKTHGIFAYLDLGEKRKIIEDSNLFGCNFAIRREIASKIGGSPPDTFPGRLKHLSGRGESEMLEKVRDLGYQTIYIPKALVYHVADSDRVTLKYFVDRHERWGVEYVYLAFRTHLSKIRSLIDCIQYGLRTIKYSKKRSIGKINPHNYKIIQNKMGLKTIKQAFRVYFSNKLYCYIKKENYLAELN